MTPHRDWCVHIENCQGQVAKCRHEKNLAIGTKKAFIEKWVQKQTSITKNNKKKLSKKRWMGLSPRQTQGEMQSTTGNTKGQYKSLRNQGLTGIEEKRKNGGRAGSVGRRKLYSPIRILIDNNDWQEQLPIPFKTENMARGLCVWTDSEVEFLKPNVKSSFGV